MTKYNNPVKTKCWENYLKEIGCEFIRIKSSHHHWKCPDCLRTITFWGSSKEIPRFQINTNLATLGINKKDFNKWLDDNC